MLMTLMHVSAVPCCPLHLPALHRAISGSYYRDRDAASLSCLHELEPLWTFSGFPTPRFSFLHVLILNLIIKFNVVGFGPDPDRCPTDVCRYVTGVVA